MSIARPLSPGGVAARRGQAAHLPGRAGPHPVRQPCSGWHANGGGDCRRLRLSQEQAAQVSALVEHHLRFRDVPRMRDSTLKRFLRLEKFEEHLGVAPSGSPFEPPQPGQLRMGARQTAGVAGGGDSSRPLVNGDDLIEMGYRPGPRFKEILRAAEDAQLEGPKLLLGKRH